MQYEKQLKKLKQRDIPDKAIRPHAYLCFVTTLGATKMGENIMVGLGEQYLKGNDYFYLTKYFHFYYRLYLALKDNKDEGLKKIVARDYRKKIAEIIKRKHLPMFIERNCLSLLAARQRDFSKLNKEHNPFEIDQTKINEKENENKAASI